MHAAQAGPGARGEPDRLWTGPFALAWVSHFMHATGLHAYVHAAGWLDERGAGEVLIGVLFSLMAVSAVLIRPFIGRLMDTRGRKPVLLLGGALHLLATLLYLAVDALPGQPWLAIAGVRVVHGLAQASLFSVLFTYAADLIPERRRAEGIAIFGVSGMIPIAVGGLVGDLVIVDGDYRGLFATTAVAAGLGLLLSLPLRETQRSGSGPGRSFLAAGLAPELRPLWFMGIAFAVGLSAYFVFLKTYLAVAPQVGTMGMFFTAYALSAVVLRLTLGWLPERVGMMRVLLPSVVLAVGGLVLLALSEGPPGLITAGVLCGIGHGYAFPILSALVVTRARADERGSALSLFTALFDIGLLIGGPLFGLSVRMVGYPGSFMLAGVVLFVATVIFGLWEAARSRAEAITAAPGSPKIG
ncbi:MFS transporter [Pseudenhygromyxa sp. WMMC2535]|uniref:MFS transporter n=1 Tax=Pseudenhygromyxa sp. WMMC2535 TaxID=2712867 RepID=UPI0015541941|nr:MFS transporter [Pseudenhygromyxa sp. WMMC2535]NVB43248.1 MFS transporter [Pseudenhygromyxa sp. WMMC2535]